VYKSANVYNSVTDFAVFVDDMIQVVEKAQTQGRFLISLLWEEKDNVLTKHMH